MPTERKSHEEDSQLSNSFSFLLIAILKKYPHQWILIINIHHSTTTLKNTRLSENRAERAKEKIANEIFR